MVNINKIKEKIKFLTKSIEENQEVINNEGKDSSVSKVCMQCIEEDLQMVEWLTDYVRILENS